MSKTDRIRVGAVHIEHDFIFPNPPSTHFWCNRLCDALSSLNCTPVTVRADSHAFYLLYKCILLALSHTPTHTVSPCVCVYPCICLSNNLIVECPYLIFGADADIRVKKSDSHISADIHTLFVINQFRLSNT